MADTRKHTLPSLLEIDKISRKSSLRPANSKSQPASSFKMPKQIPQRVQVVQVDQGSNRISPVPEENSRYSPSLQRDSIEQRGTVERYSVDRRNLKKLYTDSMHKQFSEKLDDLRRKYDYVYKNVVKDPEVDLEREKIKDIVLKSENLFHTTYSIKYFGVKDNQIGILSKRVALPQKPKTRQDDTSHTLRDKSKSKERMTTGTDGETHESVSRKDRTNRKHSSSLEHQKLKEVLSKIEGEKKKADQKELRSAKIEEETDLTIHQSGDEPRPRTLDRRGPKSMDAGQQGLRVNIADIVNPASPEKNPRESLPRVEGTTFDSIKATPSKGTIAGVSRVDDRESVRMQFDENAKYNTVGESTREMKTHDASVMTKIHETNGFDHSTELGQTVRSPEGYMVTNYFLPKKLQAPRISGYKKDERPFVGLQKTSKAQSDINNANFERTLKSVGKVKRSMLRNITAHYEDVYEDELDVLENFRTHEMRGITSNVQKYSYSSLLKSINSTQGLEDAFKEKNEKLQKILKKREDIKHEARRGLGKPYGEKTPGIDLIYNSGNRINVKVELAANNEMLNTYLKLKQKKTK